VAGVEVHGADVFGVVAVADLVVGPVLALDPIGGARADRVGRRDVGVPTVVSGDRLLGHRHAQVAVDLEDDLGHGNSSGAVREGERGDGRARAPGGAGWSGRLREDHPGAGATTRRPGTAVRQ
jgi:hypothetical protein